MAITGISRRRFRADGWQFLLLFIVLVGVLIGVVITLRQQQEMTQQLNVAGRQRYLSQRISKEALLLAQGDESQRSQLQTLSELFEASLRELVDSDGELRMLRSSTGVRPKLEQLAAQWAPVASALDTLTGGKRGTTEFEQAVSAVVAGNELVLQRADAVAAALQVASQQAVDRVLLLVYVSMTLAVSAFGGVALRLWRGSDAPPPG